MDVHMPEWTALRRAAHSRGRRGRGRARARRSWRSTANAFSYDARLPGGRHGRFLNQAARSRAPAELLATRRATMAA